MRKSQRSKTDSQDEIEIEIPKEDLTNKMNKTGRISLKSRLKNK